MHATRPIALTLLAVVFLGCGDDEPSRPRYSVQIEGVGGVTPVAGLGVEDQQAICASYDVYVDTYVDLEAVSYLACLPPALVFGGTREGCEQSLSQCMAAFPEPVAVRASAQADSVCVSGLVDCQATVAQLEGCINLNLDLVFEILEDWSCALYGNSDVQVQAQQMMDVVQVCTDLDAACNRAASPVLGPE